MGLSFNVQVGTGRAECKICEKKIKKSEFQIVAEGYQIAGSIHLKCANEIADKLFEDPIIRKKMVVDAI